MGSLKEKITGFISVAIDALKTPEMKISIAAYRNPENSNSDYSDVEGGEEGEKEGNSSAI